MTLVTSAQAEYDWRVQADAEAKALARANLLVEAKALLRPVITDHTGTAVIDLDTQTTTLKIDLDDGYCLIQANDGGTPLVTFAVYTQGKPKPDGTVTPPIVYVVQKIDGSWSRVDAVTDLDDIGRLLKKGLLT